MPTTTSRLGLVQPIGTDGAAELRVSITANAADLDCTTRYFQGTLANRSTVDSSPIAGDLYGGTDTGLLYEYNGSAWVTLMTLGMGMLAVSAQTGASYTATVGQLVIGNSSSAQTITLPSPSANALVAVQAGTGHTGAAPVTVSTPSGSIIGVGVSAASLKLGTVGAQVQLQSDGTNWYVVDGQQDTGSVALSLASNIASGGYGASAQLLGGRVWLKGTLTNNTGSTDSGTLATIPSGLRPTANVAYVVNLTGFSTATPITITTAGAISAGGGLSSSAGIDLTPVNYTLS
jgi:hypothetical protein